MALNLISSNGRSGVNYGLYTLQTDVIDSAYLSQFFCISEFSPTFTAGKNSFVFNGSTYLKNGSQIYIECLDSQGNNLYIQIATQSSTGAITYAYQEAGGFVTAIYVFGDTAEGVGHLILSGTMTDGRSVKWMANITINKTIRNNSKVRFYNTPVLQVTSAEIPVIDISSSINLSKIITFTGSVIGTAINPPKDTNLSNISTRNTDIDYRLTLTNPISTNNTNDSSSFNSQMIGNTINLIVNTIQSPLSTTQISPTVTSASYTVTGVVNNNTLQISTPYYYQDSFNNDYITNIVSASISIQYLYINYNNNTQFYQTASISKSTPATWASSSSSYSSIYKVYNSFADLTYRNIRTFSGYVGRYKVYRRSLASNVGFSVIADEPITSNEILADTISPNSFYTSLGQFYNNTHISRYWFTSSKNLSLSCTPSVAINSMFISSPNYINLSGSDYIMVKSDSTSSYRNATYIPFNMNQFLTEAGSSYDSNFMALKANSQYILNISAIILKQSSETNAGLTFYFTSSVPAISQEPLFTTTFGAQITNITSSQVGSTFTTFDNQVSFYTPLNDLYGTLVIVPKFCQAYIKNISFKVFGDVGFSPDVFSTIIPWNVSTANEAFEIKSELFDINNNLAYSDLDVIQVFDPLGLTLEPYVQS